MQDVSFHSLDYAKKCTTCTCMWNITVLKLGPVKTMFINKVEGMGLKCTVCLGLFQVPFQVPLLVCLCSKGVLMQTFHLKISFIFRKMLVLLLYSSYYYYPNLCLLCFPVMFICHQEIDRF